MPHRPRSEAQRLHRRTAEKHRRAVRRAERAAVLNLTAYRLTAADAEGRDALRDPKVLTRFWKKIQKPDDPTACWAWSGALDDSGYGAFGVLPGLQLTVHRVTYYLAYGPIPPGLELDHVVCDTPACANPHHVAPTTPVANVLRRINLPVAPREYCPAGHAMTKRNIYLAVEDGQIVRRCVACRKAAKAARKAERKARRAAPRPKMSREERLQRQRQHRAKRRDEINARLRALRRDDPAWRERERARDRARYVKRSTGLPAEVAA